MSAFSNTPGTLSLIHIYGEIPDFDDFDVAELLEDNPIGEILHAPEADVSGKWVAVFDGIGGLPCGEMASYIVAVTLAKEECPWRSREAVSYTHLDVYKRQE